MQDRHQDLQRIIDLNKKRPDLKRRTAATDRETDQWQAQLKKIHQPREDH